MEIYKTYKDRVFRLLLRDRKRLLQVYNALNGTNYDNVEDLEVTTLENAIFIKMKNDVSFITDCNMCLYEHQSSYCPNMPLRGFLYFADLYKKYIKDVELSTWRQIKIPTPYYVVFYNGTEREEEEFTQLLSEAFENGSEGCIELKVRSININYGHNKEFLEKCETLSGYAYFVAKIRSKLGEKPDEDTIKAAVAEAVEECIQEGVLKDFLLEQKAEVVAMSIYEYNEEYARKAFYEDGAQAGYARGEEEGYTRGKEDGFACGKEAGVNIGKDIGDAKRLFHSVEMLMKKQSCSVQDACESIGATMEEYDEALARVGKRE